MQDLCLGLDIGGTKTFLGVVDQAGHIVDRELFKTTQEGPEALIADILSSLKRLKLESSRLKAAGVGIAGQVEKETGMLYFAPNLGWHRVPLGSLLAEALGIPVAVTNDVRAATWGEWLFGAGRGCTDLICLFVGTGIGAGVISEGRLLTGATNSAGELGHMTLDIHGPLCNCGNHGCFEAIAGGRGIERRIKEVIAADPAGAGKLLDMAKGDVKAITARHVFDAWRLKVPAAELVIEEVKEGLIAGMATIVNAFNPSTVILGGGVIEGNPEFIEIIRSGFPKRALKLPAAALTIATAKLAGEAGVIGAADLARSKVGTDG